MRREEIGVTVTVEDATFLAGQVQDEELRALLRSRLQAGPTEVGDRIAIQLTRTQTGTMLSCLADLLAEIGLGNQDEPNPTGLRIEALIDVFNRRLWEVKQREE